MSYPQTSRAEKVCVARIICGINTYYIVLKGDFKTPLKYFNINHVFKQLITGENCGKNLINCAKMQKLLLQSLKSIGVRINMRSNANKSNNRKILTGLAVGAVNGLFGGGGGMVAVPLLQNAMGYPLKQAHATAILVIAPVCAVSAITYVFGGYASLPVIIPATMGNVAGGIIGARLLDKIPSFWVNLIFIAVMAAAGIRMLAG